MSMFLNKKEKYEIHIIYLTGSISSVNLIIWFKKNIVNRLPRQFKRYCEMFNVNTKKSRTHR